MFTVFRGSRTSEARSRSILLPFAYAPIAVGLIATLLGLVVGISQGGFDDGDLWVVMSMSVGILISGICILIYSLRHRGNDVEVEDAGEIA